MRRVAGLHSTSVIPSSNRLSPIFKGSFEGNHETLALGLLSPRHTNTMIQPIGAPARAG
jgi:hypothetical protein